MQIDIYFPWPTQAKTLVSKFSDSMQTKDPEANNLI